MTTGTLSDFALLGPTLTGFASKAIRGVMANLPAGLALAFQVNPQEVEFEKSTNYDVDTPVGYNGPIMTWVGGGPYKIRFPLFYDSTQAAVDSGLSLPNVPLVKTDIGEPLFAQNSPGPLPRVPIPTRGRIGSPPFIGVRGPISVLESFLTPQVPLRRLLGDSSRPQPPPECYLILGTLFWRTRVISAPYKVVLFDKLLTPRRMTAQVELQVIEEGEIEDANAAARKALAVGESTVGFMSTFMTVF